jgi:cardiolipin synthase (CMP-forming)
MFSGHVRCLNLKSISLFKKCNIPKVRYRAFSRITDESKSSTGEIKAVPVTPASPAPTTSVKSKATFFETFRSYFHSGDILTIPNIITYTRMVSSPFLGAAIVYDYKQTALLGCVIAGFSDWLDGYIAKNYNQMTVLGGMIDPAADKIMIGCLTVGCGIKGLIPIELATLIIGRDVLLLGASFALRAYERPKDTPFFDTTYSATFEIIPSNLSKINTVLQFGLVAATLTSWGMEVPLSIDVGNGNVIEILVPLQYLTGITTVGSLVGYLDGSAIKRLGEKNIGQGKKEHDIKNHQ